MFAGYNASPSPYPGVLGHGSAIATARTNSGADGDEPADLFPDMPDAKKRKFILVEDNVRGSRLRIRVTLEGVNTKEIPDSFRKGSSVYPRSFFPREMQSPPPSATGGSFFADDAESDDGKQETEGREISRGRGRLRARRSKGTTMVKVPVGGNKEGDLAVPRMKRSIRGREVRLNELGYRMAWLQSRVFAGRTLFLQRASRLARHIAPTPATVPCVGSTVLTKGETSGLLPQQDEVGHRVNHAGREERGAALRDASRQAKMERADAKPGATGA